MEADLHPRSLVMIFVDVNTNYHDHGGGIRTYHETKLDWFRRHPEHEYYLVVPGSHTREISVADNIHRIELRGLPLGGGYRLTYRLLIIVARCVCGRL